MNKRLPFACAIIAGFCVAVFGGCQPELVANPNYAGWAPFETGASVTMQGTQKDGKRTENVTMTEKLVSKDAEKVVIERTVQLEKGPPHVASRVEKAMIDPADHPRTHPSAKIKPKGTQKILVGDRKVLCAIWELTVNAAVPGFVDQSQDMWIRSWRNPAVPGGLVKVLLKTKTRFREIELDGQVTRFSGTQAATTQPAAAKEN
ncbi:MAG: hypothetical protein ABFD92_20485 [Planctomycetaceae bacterium]|nr:hypothetical protein [Planctomycetaceae bacterium]